MNDEVDEDDVAQTEPEDGEDGQQEAHRRAKKGKQYRPVKIFLAQISTHNGL